MRRVVRWTPADRSGFASNKVVEAYRAAGRDRSVPTDVVPDEPDLDHGPDQAALHGGVVAELRQLLDQQHREILVLRVALGMTSMEIAAAVGSTSGAVRVTQHRAWASGQTVRTNGVRFGIEAAHRLAQLDLLRDWTGMTNDEFASIEHEFGLIKKEDRGSTGDRHEVFDPGIRQLGATRGRLYPLLRGSGR
jgi:hypothetical protein